MELKRRTIIILSALALILALLVYWILLLLGLAGWAEIWLAGLLSCVLTLACFWLLFRLLDYLTKRKRSRELLRNHCPVCGTDYSSQLQRCPNCMNPS